MVQDPAPARRPAVLRVLARIALAAVLGYVAVGSLLVWVGRYAAPLPVSAPSLDIGFGVVDGREVAIVPFVTDAPRGLLGLPEWLASDGRVVLVSAIDLETREEVWRTRLSGGHPPVQASVVAVGSALAYVATDDGMVILDVRDGDIVARDGGIAGLGGHYLASRTAYAAHRSDVVTLTKRGDVLAIPVDGTRARQADAAATLAWRDRLNLPGDRTPFSGTAEFPEAFPVPDGRIRVEDDTITVAIGARVTATHHVVDRVRGVVVSPRGRVVALTTSEDIGQLVVATPDGIHAIPVGDCDFVGFCRG